MRYYVAENWIVWFTYSIWKILTSLARADDEAIDIDCITRCLTC